ncbi:hypothetical protein [Nonomuraea sp. 10N515B]|uniref:hypothetical protein n=1 Tax=Nonomuraea sp. 10N515B TaxID=3457422 RepID=UPI003FCD4C51
MANEVEIVISTRDRSGPGLAAVRARAGRFGADLGQTMAKAGQQAGQQLGEGLVRGVDGRLRDSRGRFIKGGQDLGDGIADGIKDGTERGGRIVSGFATSTLRTFSRLGPGMGAAITAGLVGAAASAGTVAGAITLAVGGALTGIGVVSAAQSEAVRREWRATGKDLKAGLADAAQPLEQSAMRAATVTRTTFSRLKPFLADFFERSAPAVDRFVASIGEGVASLGPALEPVRRGYTAVLDAISNRSPAIFGSLERSLENLGETAEEHADDIAAAFEFTASAVEKTTEALGFLADEWDNFTSDISAANEAGKDFGRSVAEALVDAYEAVGINTDRMKEMREEWAAADAAAANSSGVKDASAATSGLGSAADDAAAGLRDLKAEMEELNGPALDAAEAQIRVEEAIDRASEAIRKNGATLDVNTAKGRANKDALIDIARAAQDHIAAMQAEGASADAITAKYGSYRGQLVHAARQAGLTRGQAERLAEAWLAMPDSVTTHAKGNISDLEAKIAAAKAKLKDPGLTRPERARIRAEISDLQRKVAAAKAALAGVQSKTVSISLITRYTTIGHGTVLAPGRAHGGVIGGLGGVKRFATGGVAGSGSSLAMVGEQGPELVRLPVGSTVTPAGQTKAQLAQSGFGSISMAFRAAAGGGGGDVASSMRDLASALREVVSLRDGLDKLTGSVFGQTRALMAYEEAWDAAQRALKENGKTLNITKEKGRENRSALLSLAEAAHEVVIAMREKGSSITTVTKKMKEQRAEFIRMARTFGLTSKQASAMADRLGLIPSQVKKILETEKRDLAYNKRIDSGKASGGIAGGWTMVGERGAELVRLPFGSQVTPAGQTAAMLAGGGGGTLTVVLETRGGQSEFDRFMAAWIRQFVHAKGGQVQTAFGRS